MPKCVIVAGGASFLGSHLCRALLELADTILVLTGSKSRIVHEALPVDDPRQRNLDVRLAREKRGRKPTVSLREGLIATIAYVRRSAAR